MSGFKECDDPKCACHQRDEKGRPMAIHVQFECEREIRIDYDAPNEYSGPPMYFGDGEWRPIVGGK